VYSRSNGQRGGYSDEGSLTEERDRRSSFTQRSYTEDHSQGHEARERFLSPEHSNKSRLSAVWTADTFTQTEDESQHGLGISYATSTTQTDEKVTKGLAESSFWINNYAEIPTQTTYDGPVANLQEVVERLAKAYESLRQRYDQSKDVCDTQSVQIEELTTQSMTVKSENDSLKQDLGFDHSCFLFLKLQLQALEV
jgi:chromosome segregation ATPase